MENMQSNCDMVNMLQYLLCILQSVNRQTAMGRFVQYIKQGSRWRNSCSVNYTSVAAWIPVHLPTMVMQGRDPTNYTAFDWLVVPLHSPHRNPLDSFETRRSEDSEDSPFLVSP